MTRIGLIVCSGDDPTLEVRRILSKRELVPKSLFETIHLGQTELPEKDVLIVYDTSKYRPAVEALLTRYLAQFPDCRVIVIHKGKRNIRLERIDGEFQIPLLGTDPDWIPLRDILLYEGALIS